MNVSDIMTKTVATCQPNDNLQKVALLMKQNDCGAVPIVKGNQVTGIITDRDIVIRAVAEGKNPLDLEAESCMTKDIRTVAENASLKECMDVMEKEQIRRVVVTGEDGQVCGIVAQADIALNAPRKETGDTVKRVSE
jgi:CBS domain-containing protein